MFDGYDLNELRRRIDERSVDTANGCREWTGPVRRDARRPGPSYGMIGIGDIRTTAHRVAWMLANGPIEAGMSVMHLCDNPRCVKVEHLQLGTHTDNMRDMQRKRRWVSTRREPRACTECRHHVEIAGTASMVRAVVCAHPCAPGETLDARVVPAEMPAWCPRKTA